MRQKDIMKLLADILLQYGVGVPKGKVARSGAEAESIAKSLGMRNSRPSNGSHYKD